MSAVCGAAAVAIGVLSSLILSFVTIVPRQGRAGQAVARAWDILRQHGHWRIRALRLSSAQNREGYRMSHLPPTTDDRVIWDAWESMFRLPAMTVADEVGIFRALGDAQLTTDALAAQLGLE